MGDDESSTPGRASLTAADRLAADLPSCIARHRLEWVGQAWREGPETRDGTGGWDQSPPIAAGSRRSSFRLKIPVSGVQFSPCPPSPLNSDAHFALAGPRGPRRAGVGLRLNLGGVTQAGRGRAAGRRTTVGGLVAAASWSASSFVAPSRSMRSSAIA
jgi:hypothetical protein